MAEARTAINKEQFDLILTDFFLPDGTGPDFVIEMKKHFMLPFVVMTSCKDAEIEKLVLNSGATDFIPKNEMTGSFLERVLKFAIERNKINITLKEQSLRDPLTGLYNRLGMENLITSAVLNYQKTSKPFSLFLIDIDNFKTINDTYGHSVGDGILKQFAATLTSENESSSKNNFAIRFGGDEFSVLCTELEDTEQASGILDNIIKNLSTPIMVEGYQISVAFSIGIAFYPDDGKSYDELISNADFSLYNAKRKKGISIEFFDRDKRRAVQKRNFIENNLVSAIKNDQFLLCYQPKLDTKQQTLSGCEALIRWNHPEKGIIWPREFVHITEETGHILEIGKWVLHEACKQCAKWHKKHKPISISVNVSIRQLLHSSFISLVKEILDDTGLEPQYLELEITETLVIENLKASVQILRELRRMGISISIDDFGTGYSSLSRLRMLPIDKLKIDRSLIRKVGKNRFDTAIAKTVLSLAKNLKLVAIAEGVETEEQFRFLKNAACPEVQGYYFSKPLNAECFEKNYINEAAA